MQNFLVVKSHALSVICFANASSPKERAKKPVRTAHLTHQIIFCADLPACCSFRHGLRRATFLREEGFGFPRLPLGEMSRSDREGGLPYEGAGLPPCGKTEGVLSDWQIRIRFTLRCTCLRVCPLSHLLRKCQLSQRESREAGATAHMPHQVIFFADLPACCSFRHGLRRATFLREEGFGFPRNPTCLSLWERCRAATERAGISYILSPVCPEQTCLRVCPLSHLLRKCQLSQGESQEVGANCSPDESK